MARAWPVRPTEKLFSPSRPRWLARALGATRGTSLLSPSTPPPRTVRPTRARSRARWYERDTLARSLAAPSLAPTPAGCVRRRPTPTSDCTLLSFHIEQLTVAAAGRNSGMRNISPRVPCVPLPWRRAVLSRPSDPLYAELCPVDL